MQLKPHYQHAVISTYIITIWLRIFYYVYEQNYYDVVLKGSQFGLKVCWLRLTHIFHFYKKNMTLIKGTATAHRRKIVYRK